MKKIVLLISCMLFSLNVYAENFTKQVTYLIEIGEEKYNVTVNFVKNDENEMYQIGNIVMKNKYSENYMQIASASDEGFLFLNNDFNCNLIKNAKQNFTFEEIETGKYLPTFIKYDGDLMSNHIDFLFYIPNENLISDEENEKEKLIKLLNYVKESNDEIGLDGKGKITIDNFQKSLKIIDSSDIKSDYELNQGELTSDEYIRRAEILRELVEEAKKIDVCTEVDLSKLRTLRNVSLFDIIDLYDDITLSNACYNTIFGSGLGKGNLYTMILEGYNKIDSYKENEIISLMAYLYYESYYLEGVGILEGSLMQKEIVPVVQCNWLGDKTTEIIQYAFDILKLAGIVIGTLLAIVDIFKAIVQKDKDSNKQLGTLMKRIIAIVALILTPILVDIIFEFINTVGIDNPICGIR